MITFNKQGKEVTLFFRNNNIWASWDDEKALVSYISLEDRNIGFMNNKEFNGEKISGFRIEDKDIDNVKSFVSSIRSQEKDKKEKEEKKKKERANSLTPSIIKMEYNSSLGFKVTGIDKENNSIEDTREEFQEFKKILNYLMRESFLRSSFGADDFYHFLKNDHDNDYTFTLYYEIPYKIFLEKMENLKKMYEENEKEKKEKRLKSLEKELSELKKEDLINSFTKKIHVDEDGKFSTCDAYCDDCFWYNTWNKEIKKEVKDVSESFIVEGKNKRYNYYKVCDESKKIFYKLYDSELNVLYNKQKEEIENKIKEVVRSTIGTSMIDTSL